MTYPAFRKARAVARRPKFMANNIESSFARVQERFRRRRFVPVCESIGYVYQAFLAGSLRALHSVAIVAHILWKDFTAYGASRGRVVLQLHAVFASLSCLVILNYPLLRLAFSAVDLSYQFKRALDQLKKLQVQMLSSNPDLFEQYYLRASIWDGKRFGIREPLSQIHLDALFWSTLRYRTGIVSIFVLVLLGAMVWRASVVRVRQWRRNLGAVARPGCTTHGIHHSCGSGCAVQAGRVVLYSSPTGTRGYCGLLAACCIAEPTRPVPADGS